MDHYDKMNRSSSRKVKLTSKFEEFKLTANGKKRGRPRKIWPQDAPPVDGRASMPTTRDELLRSREENKPIITATSNTNTTLNNTTITSTPAPKAHVGRPISSRKEELMRLREENINLKRQLDQKEADFEELKRQTSYTGETVPKGDFEDLKQKYERDITYAKKHEWCVICLNPSRYYCCWNTTYCSQKCQVTDWYARHGKSCLRAKSAQGSFMKKKEYV